MLDKSLFSSNVKTVSNSKDPRNFTYGGRSYKIVLDTQDGGLKGVNWQNGKYASFAGKDMLSGEAPVFSKELLKAINEAASQSVKRFKDGGFKATVKNGGKSGTYTVLELV